MYLPLERINHLPLKRNIYTHLLACGEKAHMIAYEEKDLPASGERNSCLHVDG